MIALYLVKSTLLVCINQSFISISFIFSGQEGHYVFLSKQSLSTSVTDNMCNEERDEKWLPWLERGAGWKSREECFPENQAGVWVECKSSETCLHEQLPGTGPIEIQIAIESFDCYHMGWVVWPKSNIMVWVFLIPFNFDRSNYTYHKIYLLTVQQEMFIF